MFCSALNHIACTQIQIRMLMALILCVAGVEVSLLTWRTWDVGLPFSLHNLTATYALVRYHKHATSAYVCPSTLTRCCSVTPASVGPMSGTSFFELMWGSSFQSSISMHQGYFLPEKTIPNIGSINFAFKCI